MNHALPRLLVVADAVVPTGFARLSESLLRRLVGDFEVHQLGINYAGPERDIGWRLHPCALAADRNQGVDELPALMERLRPDVVLLINDVDVLGDYAQVLERCRRRSRVAAYFPVDSGPIEPEVLRPVLRLCDRSVTYTEFGRAQVLDSLRRDGLDPDADAIAVIPHGVDRAQFRPVCDGGDDALERSMKQARQLLFPRHPELADAFIVLNANRNQPRKCIDTTIKGFARFAAGKPPGVKLHLHMGALDEGWNLPVLARRHGIEDRVILSTTERAMPRFSVDRLNQVYNACDVGLNTASAEGWGFCAFEHAAAGHAQVVPGHTSQLELWGDAGECVMPRFVTTSPRSLTSVHHVVPGDVAQALERLYENRSYRRDVARRCHARACEERFSWDAIGRTWSTLLAGLLP